MVSAYLSNTQPTLYTPLQQNMITPAVASRKVRVPASLQNVNAIGQARRKRYSGPRAALDMLPPNTAVSNGYAAAPVGAYSTSSNTDNTLMFSDAATGAPISRAAMVTGGGGVEPSYSRLGQAFAFSTLQQQATAGIAVPTSIDSSSSSSSFKLADADGAVSSIRVSTSSVEDAADFGEPSASLPDAAVPASAISRNPSSHDGTSTAAAAGSLIAAGPAAAGGGSAQARAASSAATRNGTGDVAPVAAGTSSSNGSSNSAAATTDAAGAASTGASSSTAAVIFGSSNNSSHLQASTNKVAPAGSPAPDAANTMSKGHVTSASSPPAAQPQPAASNPSLAEQQSTSISTPKAAAADEQKQHTQGTLPTRAAQASLSSPLNVVRKVIQRITTAAALPTVEPADVAPKARPVVTKLAVLNAAAQAVHPASVAQQPVSSQQPRVSRIAARKV